MSNLFNVMFSNQTAVIIRGLSGAGKSTLAQQIAGSSAYNGCSVSIHETDTFFVDDNGSYNFDPSKLGDYHAENLRLFKQSIDNGTHIVINSNTNTMHWEYAEYVKYAVSKGYNVQIIDLFDNGNNNDNLHERQQHDFPYEKYDMCRDRYEREYGSINAE